MIDLHYYVLHGSFARKRKIAAVVSCSAAKVRIKPVQSDMIRTRPPRAVPKPLPTIWKIVFIDIMVPLESGACSISKLVSAGKAKAKKMAPIQLRTTMMDKSFKSATRIKTKLEAIKPDTSWRFRPTLFIQ